VRRALLDALAAGGAAVRIDHRKVPQHLDSAFLAHPHADAAADAPDLADRTHLLAGGRRDAADKDLLGGVKHGDHAAGASRLAERTARAEVFVDVGQPVFAHRDRAKGAHTGAGAKAQAAKDASLGPLADEISGPAVEHPFVVGPPGSKAPGAATADPRHAPRPVDVAVGQAQGLGKRLNLRYRRDRAMLRDRLTPGQSLRHRGATGHAAGAAVVAG